MRVKGDGIFSINTSASGGFGSAGISLPETVADAGGGGDSPPITEELQLYINPEADVYSDAGTTLAVNGDNIRQINDQSGNGANIVQPIASSQFVYTADALGTGNFGLYKAAAADHMDFASTLSIAGPDSSFTFYTVYDKTNTAEISYLFGTTDGNFNRILEYQNSRIYIQDTAGVNFFATITNAADLAIRAFTLDTSADTITTYVNGALVSSGYKARTWGDFNFDNFWGNGAVAYIGQTLLYSEAHDATQVGQISDWLNTKYSIY
jgi:hypothetical protein